VITGNSSSKDRRIHWYLAKLRAGLGKIHAGYCKCEACHAARKLREEFGIFDED
jgi:hypothetical protein